MNDISKKNHVSLGSSIAKGGFQNEKDIKKKFENWKTDNDAQLWLRTMRYKLREIEKIDVKLLSDSHSKADIQVQIKVYFKEIINLENISIKLVSNAKNGFNQVDKRYVIKYQIMWSIPKKVVYGLKLFTGEIKPTIDSTDPRKLNLNEMSWDLSQAIVKFFEENKHLVISDIIKGNDRVYADWMLVSVKEENKQKWVLKNINQTINIFSRGNVRITSKGNLKIGEIGMQRKGGDGGRSTANMLQFKINPLILFDKI